MNVLLIEHHNRNACIAVCDMKQGINRMKTTLTSKRMTSEKWAVFLVFAFRVLIAIIVMIIELRNVVDLLVITN
jgi:hypothetical protein